MRDVDVMLDMESAAYERKLWLIDGSVPDVVQKRYCAQKQACFAAGWTNKEIMEVILEGERTALGGR
jgi:hypothetical protein